MTKLVEITKDDYNLELDIRYASKNNVCEIKLYNSDECFLHSEAAEKLKKAISLAKTKNLRLKIFDAFRPISVQKFMYDKFQNDFVSNPETGSIPHCRGVAVDLTLIDENNQELEMGSDFDEFSQKAFHGNKDISEIAQKNRILLLEIMTKAGFDFFENEWWHYQLFNARKYDIAEVKYYAAV